MQDRAFYEERGRSKEMTAPIKSQVTAKIRMIM